MSCTRAHAARTLHAVRTYSTPHARHARARNPHVRAPKTAPQDDAPIIWRGPMATKALDKLMLGTDWGRLDVLVIDMPPGGAGMQSWFETQKWGRGFGTVKGAAAAAR